MFRDLSFLDSNWPFMFCPYHLGIPFVVYTVIVGFGLFRPIEERDSLNCCETESVLGLCSSLRINLDWCLVIVVHSCFLWGEFSRLICRRILRAEMRKNSPDWDVIRTPCLASVPGLDYTISFAPHSLIRRRSAAEKGWNGISSYQLAFIFGWSDIVC